MNIRIKRRSLAYLVAALTIACIILFVSWLWYLERYDGVADSPNTLSDFGDKLYFAIDPETILADLDRGEAGVFTSEIATPENPIFGKTIEWLQADYLKIANALNQFVWNETLENWNLYYIHLKAACQDDIKGFGIAEIAYFKTVPYDALQKNYTVRAFHISPQYGYVVSSGGAIFPQPLFDRWKSVDLGKLGISAEDALKIAEENGARTARLSVQDQCTIRVRLSGNDNWRVFIYADDTGSSIFRMEVDEYTGKIK